MGNRRNRRSKRLETLSPEREESSIRDESSETGNITLINATLNVENNLGESGKRNRLVDPSQISNEIQAWTEIFEQRNNDRILKMREELENKLNAILKEVKSNKSVSTATNPRSDTNETENTQPSGSKNKRSMGVNAPNFINSDSEDEDYPLKASDLRDLQRPAKPFFQSETDLDATVIPNEDSEPEEDYHKHFVAFKFYLTKVLERH